MTHYCPQITRLSQFLWHYMSDVFRYGLSVSEIGITKHLIYDIISFYNHLGVGLEAYAKPARDEKQRGADIDLFIQNSLGNYHHYMLQSKVMDFDGRYQDIRNFSPNAQFFRLIQAAQNENALPLYLLYNGNTSNSSQGDLNFGASIIHASVIRDIRTNQIGLSTVPRITFNQLFQAGMEPYQVLFCKGSNVLPKPPEKSKDEIFTGYPYKQITPIVAEQVDIVNDDSNYDVNEYNQYARFRLIVKYTKKDKYGRTV